jgi:ABC-type glycerol-3-phosphate transport system permease component
MWNSFFVTVSSVAVSTLIALLAAYAAVFGRFPGHRIFLSTSVALMVVPPVTLLVPMFVFMVDTGLVNHLQSVIIFYTGLLVPFAVFFLANFFRTVPQELIEAASVEGAGPFTVLRRIVMPLSGAAAFTLVVVQAIWVWNELLIALVFLQNDSARTLMAGLAQFQGRYATNEPLVLAGALVSIAPVVFLYLSGQRFFVRGLTAGIGK